MKKRRTMKIRFRRPPRIRSLPAKGPQYPAPVVSGPELSRKVHERIQLSPKADRSVASWRLRTRGIRPDSGLELERAAYEAAKPQLLEECPGKFVVFVGDEMSGPYASFRAAYRGGTREFGLGPMYIKQVVEQEETVESGATDDRCPS